MNSIGSVAYFLLFKKIIKLFYDIINYLCFLINKTKEHRNSAENLRQQVLLNTIANLKKSLEDQSASLKQVYTSSKDVQL